MCIKILIPISLIGIGAAPAAITTTSNDVPASTFFFSDNGGDYFNLVDTPNSGSNPPTGTFVDSTTYESTGVVPIAGSIAGRDHDDGNIRPEQVQASWILMLPGDAASATGFTNINFSGTVAATQNAWDRGTIGGVDNIHFDFFINGSLVGFLHYEPNGAAGGGNYNLALDTNADGTGDGQLISETGTNFSFSAVGGAATTLIEVRGTYFVDDGSAAHWTFGTLSADYDMVPEPSSALLLGLGSLGLIVRRSRKPVNF
ncbi:PEP-CTERM sorting domain-containing protein [Luteolibacter sp. AS25]|uniref:PEP-CTERM sorting domain-containing protein n=1 Tax=Luteolibacter sp. AS25 TaxID=3135776 RepID=UPI00398AA14D